MPSKPRLITAVIAFASFNIIVFIIFVSSSNSAPPRVEKSVGAAEVSIQRKRIDDFIDFVASCSSIEKLSEALNKPTPGDFIVFDAGFHAGDMIAGPSLFNQIFADRRVARLYEILDKMQPADASRVASSLFESKLDIHIKDWQRGIQNWRKDEIRPVPIPNNYHALSCSLFLCSHFCEASEVLLMTEKWSNSIKRIEVDIRSEESLKLLLTELSSAGIPDELYFLNLYLSCYQRKLGIDQNSLSVLLGEHRVRLEKKDFLRWDANPFDFTHVHRDAPLDKSRLLTTIMFVRNWPGAIVVSPKRQRKITSQFRHVLSDL